MQDETVTATVTKKISVMEPEDPNLDQASCHSLRMGTESDENLEREEDILEQIKAANDNYGKDEEK